MKQTAGDVSGDKVLHAMWRRHGGIMKKDFTDKFYQVYTGAKDNYRIYSPVGVFMDLFVGREKALLLDTGYGFGNLKDLVRNITDLPLIIVNTHAHVDHACGNWQFDGPVYLHPKDFKLAEDHCGPYRRERALHYARHFSDPVTGQEIDLLGEDFNGQAYLTRGSGAFIPLKEGQIFDLGGLHLRCVHVPGHTAGSTGLIYEEEKIFYSGDSMNFQTWLFLPEAEKLSVYIESIKKMQAEDFAKIMFSHEPELYEKNVLSDFLDLAEHLDYEKGMDFTAPLAPGQHGRMIIRDGCERKDKGRGYASVVISREKI